ncbi:hypothetical protein [Jannaschia sp. LMIT008]|uniref:hypothetical protein n=1 Tax=Jannaschia maritima TaxID=3032585 RepID=UPI0028109FF6|nr:hypothetical protein [Jannaschia sp. LMIT008]
MRLLTIVLLSAVLTGCGFFREEEGPAEPAPIILPPTGQIAAAPTGGGATVVAPPSRVTARAEALDTVSEAEKQQARIVAASAASADLGTETVALGDPAEPGLWVKTDLVSAEVAGKATAAGGTGIALTLRPLGGAGGAQISLSALQALGLPLAGLHPVTLARVGG